MAKLADALAGARRGAEIGRQAGLRIQCPKGHESSSLSRGTGRRVWSSQPKADAAFGTDSPSTHDES